MNLKKIDFGKCRLLCILFSTLVINADNILVEKVRKRTSVQVVCIELCSYVSYEDIVTFHLNRLVSCFHGFEGSKPRVFFLLVQCK